RSARLVSATAEELGSGAGDALGNSESLLAALDAARPSNDGQVGASDADARSIRAGKIDDSVVGLGVATHQFVGLRNFDDFLHARHLFQRAGLDFSLVAGDADGGALRSGHGVGAVSERFDFLANGAHLLFGGLRLHDYEHSCYPGLFSLAGWRGTGQTVGAKPWLPLASLAPRANPMVIWLNSQWENHENWHHVLSNLRRQRSGRYRTGT